jgi:SAM-dependent methyltransferase
VIGRAAQSLRLRAADAADAVLGRRDELTPPRRLADYVGDSDFRTTGEEFLGHLRELAGLEAGDRVLDVGCGIGRIARVLVPVLRPPGSYDGFDIVEPGIAWCREHYGDTPAPFRFQHADLRNAAYNPGGRESAASYRFPYDDGCFGLVFATSVFTHLLAVEADRYLSEAARVLAPGGRLFTTWFLLSSEELQASPPPPFRSVEALAPAFVADPAIPEAAVAYEESWLRERLVAHGLELGAIDPGSWRGRPGTSRQDLVLARRG